MNTYLNTALATEHLHQLITEAADARRSRTERNAEAGRRPARRNPHNPPTSDPRFDV